MVRQGAPLLPPVPPAWRTSLAVLPPLPTLPVAITPLPSTYGVLQVLELVGKGLRVCVHVGPGAL